jgi:hypothetical protein
MSFVTQVSNVITRVGTEFKAVRALLGNLGDLTTTVKSTLVGAINELASEITSGGAVIDDAAPALDKTYSSTKIETDLGDAISDLRDELRAGAGAALDTFAEVAAQLATDEGATAALTTAVGNRVRFDAAQALSSPQKAQAIANIGAISATDVGDPATDFVAIFEAALV